MNAYSVLGLAILAASSAQAQPDRISSPIDPNQTVVLRSSVHPLAQPQYDQGPVAPSFQLPYITPMLKPSAAQQAALEQLLRDQQNPASPQYRRWLPPEQYADRFGASPATSPKSPHGYSPRGSPLSTRRAAEIGSPSAARRRRSRLRCTPQYIVTR